MALLSSINIDRAAEYGRQYPRQTRRHLESKTPGSDPQLLADILTNGADTSGHLLDKTDSFAERENQRIAKEMTSLWSPFTGNEK